jgi:hypothetical protein
LRFIWELRLVFVIGLILGSGLILSGSQTFCSCPNQIVGQPPNCSCAQSLDTMVIIGISILIISAVGVAFSFLKPQTTKDGTAN